MRCLLRAVFLVTAGCLFFTFFTGSDPFSTNRTDRQETATSGTNRNTEPVKRYDSFLDALKNQANSKGEIILVSTDYGYIQMALNLYLTSFQKLNINNYLYVTSADDAADVLDKNGIAHFRTDEDKDGKNASNFGTAAFKRKTHIKTKIVHEALLYGFTVRNTDVDIVFLQDPFPYLACSTCDIQIQSDNAEANTGFYFARPTRAALRLHKMALELAARRPELADQDTMNWAMDQMTKQELLKVKTLSLDLFPNGKAYFEVGHRMFSAENPCKNCVIIHNTWIVSGAAKVYRFKEHFLWMVDTDGYYSNPDVKYLVYENPIDFGNTTRGKEREAFKAALMISRLLGRVLILPSFHCYDCRFQACKQPSL